MASQSSGSAPQANLWHLPKVESVQARLRRFEQARTYYVGSEPVQVWVAVEFAVQTDAPLPVRAVTPVLFVGETPIPDYDSVNETEYRFWAYDPSRLQAGARIALGWPELPERREPTRFRYQPPGAPVA